MSFRQYKSVWIVENTAFAGGYNLYECKDRKNRFTRFLGWAGNLAGAREWITEHPLSGAKTPSKNAAQNKASIDVLSIAQRPKKGDAVSLEFRYMGLVSYENYLIERVRLNQVWIDAHDHPFDVLSGRYSRDEDGARRELKFDGGRRAAQADADSTGGRHGSR